jgi:hypothetical protein
VCHEEKTLDSFPKHVAHFDNLDTRCRDCIRNQSKIRRKLKKENPPPPPGPCPHCGKHTSSWHLDHCHETDTFRIYICESCNLGQGKLKDDPWIIARALLTTAKHAGCVDEIMEFLTSETTN